MEMKELRVKVLLEDGSEDFKDFCERNPLSL